MWVYLGHEFGHKVWHVFRQQLATELAGFEEADAMKKLMPHGVSRAPNKDAKARNRSESQLSRNVGVSLIWTSSSVDPPLRTLIEANDIELDVQTAEHHIHRERLTHTD